MLVVTIDMGTYSLKILESRIDKKKISHVNQFEIRLPQEEIFQKIQSFEEEVKEEKTTKQSIDIHKILPELEFQINAFNQYLSKIPHNSKVLIQSPFALTTTRFLNIPIANRKKAEMMVPFQLEEGIPYPLNKVFIANTFNKNNKSFDVTSNLIEKEVLGEIHAAYKKSAVLPSYMCSELSGWANYLSKSEEFKDKNYAIINLGHSQSQFICVKDQKIISYSYSSFGGKLINEMLMSEYEVAIEKAIEFKHQNSFYLTPEQYSDVDEKQQSFATKMNEVTQSLISDYKRWELTTRVNHNIQIDKIFICGGTSKIKNIENYLAQSLGHKVEFAKDWNSQLLSLPIERWEYLNLANVNALSSLYLERQNAGNFLTGELAPEKSGEIPIHSLSFVGVRTFIIAFIVMTGFLTHTFFLDKKDQLLTKNLSGTLSQPALELTQRERAIVKKRPATILKKIQAKTKILKKQIKTLEEQSSAKSLIGLFSLIQKINSQCYLQKYTDTFDGLVQATFSGCESQDILELETQLSTMGLNNLDTKASPNQGELKVNFNL